MRILFFLSFLLLPTFLFSQEKKTNELDFNSTYNRSDSVKKPKKVATIDLYRFVTLERDTTYVDTTLTIKKLYSFNYLRKDNFGLLALPNEGQTYNTLQYSLNNFSPLPEFGFTAKHSGYLQANDIRYYSVATPVSDLYYKTVMKQGQNTDVFFTLNISPRLNFSVAYRGLRSEGKYINQLASTGSFRFTTSYNALNKRYFSNFHFAGQDISNEENGGITTIDDFESGNASFQQRDRLEVYLTDAESLLKGKRYFLDHSFRINPEQGDNNLYVSHQFNYENKYYSFQQATIASTVGDETVYRFGDSYLSSGINDRTEYNKTYNKLGLTYENTSLGKFQFYADDYFSNFYYNKILILDNQTVPSSLTRRIDCFAGQYDYRKDKWNATFLFSRSMSNQSLSNLDAKINYDFDEDTQFSFEYQNMNKLPNDNYNLFQSSYVAYNWSNDFKNEKINSIRANANTKWGNLSAQYTVFNDFLYFKDNSTDAELALDQQIVAPAQYENTINYLSLKASKEFNFGKFALDNTLLFQKVDQSELILNVPEFLTRNTLYYSDHAFNKALYFQTGVTFNYFTNYYANEYNPVIGEFFVQNQKEIGNYTNFDFFFNAKIQRARIFLILEHFNSSLSGNNFYSTPNNPYRDFIIRFGLVWTFFQ